MASQGSHSSFDKEKQYEDGDNVNVNAVYISEEEAPDHVISNRFGALGPYLQKLFASGVEARGVERVPENQRETRHIWNK